MPHDHHFLSRLDRVDSAHVELALGLYRDVDLLRLILSHHAGVLPPDAARVALSLGDRSLGPFIIVTRDGHFVTCLAQGMSLSADCPVITRDQLERVATCLDTLRDKIHGRSRAQNAAEWKRLSGRVVRQADAMTYEDMHAAVRLAPMMEHWIRNSYVANATASTQLFLRAACVRKPHRGDHDLLARWWRSTWSMSITAMLMGQRDPRTLARTEADSQAMFSGMAVYQGLLPVALRVLWGTGTIGEVLLPGYRDGIETGHGDLDAFNCTAALTAIGHRNPHLQASVRGWLSAEHRAASSPDAPRRPEWVEQAVSTALATFDDPDAAVRAHTQWGRSLAFQQSSRFPVSSPWRFERADDIPDALAGCVAANAHADYFTEPSGRDHLIQATAWLARVDAEDLFLPASWREHASQPQTTEQMLAALEPLRRIYPSKRVGPGTKAPAPNEPCPCGSGRKHKKCCGRPGDAV